MSQDQDQTLKNYKTIIIGKSSVGKSTLLLRYVDGQYNPQKPTIGIDYRFKKIIHKDSTFFLQLWDSAGQQRYRTIVYNYFTLSKAACIVFDLNAKTWLQQLVLHCGNQIPKILLGNKSDLFTTTELKETLEKYKEKIEELKSEFNCEFFAVSALTGANINEAFDFLVKQIYEKNKENNSSIVKSSALKLAKSKIDENKQQRKKQKNCC